MPPEPKIFHIAREIQYAVAPVFLLTGIASLLGVLSMRLGRIVDRARKIEDALLNAQPKEKQRLIKELDVLVVRAKLIQRSIAFCTGGALLICLVIAFLFIGGFIALDFSNTIASLFILATLAVIVGLLLFLREIFLAIQSLQLGVFEREAESMQQK